MMHERISLETLKNMKALYSDVFREMAPAPQWQEDRWQGYWNDLERSLRIIGVFPKIVVDFCGGGYSGEIEQGKWVYFEAPPAHAIACAKIGCTAVNVDVAFPPQPHMVPPNYYHIQRDVLDPDLRKFLPKSVIPVTDLVTLNTVFTFGTSRQMKISMYDHGLFQDGALYQILEHAWHILRPGGIFVCNFSYSELVLQKQGTLWQRSVPPEHHLFNTSNWKVWE